MSILLFRRCACLLVFLFIIQISASAFGQSYQSFLSSLEQISKLKKFKFGPFWIFPTFQLKNLGYDDNVYYQREEDEQISDFTGTLSPGVNVYFLFRNRLLLSLTENPEYVFYFEQKRERRLNNTFSAELKYLFLNRFMLSGGYLDSNKRRRATSEFDVRANERVKSYTARSFYETARKTSFGLSGAIRKIRYEDITLPDEEIYLARALNRKEKSGHLEVYYRVFSESFFFIKAGYTDYEFDYAQSSWRDSSSYQVYAGMRFPLLGRLRGNLSLGYKRLDPRTGGRPGFTGLVGSGNLDYRFWRLAVRINYNRDCHFSYWTNNIFFNEDRYGAGISFYILSFVRVDYSLTYGEAHYPEPMSVRMADGSFDEITREDIYRVHSIGLVFRVIRDIGLGMTVSFWERDSNYFRENRKRMFIGGYVTYEF